MKEYTVDEINSTLTQDLSSGAYDVLWQLFRCGPTWDGDICTKSGRGELFATKLATRHEGWTILTLDGLKLCLRNQYDRKKEKMERQKYVQCEERKTGKDTKA